MSSIVTTGGGGGIDPNYSNVALLLHFDGTNGSQTFTDNSPSPKTLTAAGSGATLSTSQFQFGTASLNLSGATNAYVTTPSNAAFDIGTGDFTVEGWIRTGAGNGVVFDRYSVAVGGIQIELVSATLRLYLDGAYRINGTTSIVTNTWYYFACTRASGTLRLFIDGVAEGSSPTYTGNLTRNVPVVLGATQTGAGRFTGFIDEFRFTPGVARYTSNFTTPVAPFPNS